MLADPYVDAVVIAVAGQFHVPLTKSGLEAGKHVMVKKPLGTSVEQCEGLRDRRRSSGLVLQIGNNSLAVPSGIWS